MMLESGMENDGKLAVGNGGRLKRNSTIGGGEE